MDLAGRAEQLLEQHVDENGRFLLDFNNNPSPNLAMRQALYLWASKAVNQHRFSYEIWRAIEYQLESHPHNRQWTLPLGDGWYVERLGDSLQMGSSMVGDRPAGNAKMSEVAQGLCSLTWSFANGPFANDEMTKNGKLVVACDEKLIGDGNCNGFSFVISKAGTSEGKQNRWMFTPPWRTGRSPLTLGSFLRGQKVPLHLRASASIIYCQHRKLGMDELAEPVFVAVCINNKWIVDAAWVPDRGEGGSRELNISTIILNLADEHELQDE
jgi:hypothetical protein